MSTALCEAYLSKLGSLFNTKEFNYMFEMIFKDLTLLYEILQDILLNEYNQLKVYIETHLNELEIQANLFQRRLDEEMAATSLGKLLFMKTNDWDIETNSIINSPKVCPHKKFTSGISSNPLLIETSARYFSTPIIVITLSKGPSLYS